MVPEFQQRSTGCFDHCLREKESTSTTPNFSKAYLGLGAKAQLERLQKRKGQTIHFEVNESPEKWKLGITGFSFSST